MIKTDIAVIFQSHLKHDSPDSVVKDAAQKKS